MSKYQIILQLPSNREVPGQELVRSLESIANQMTKEFNLVIVGQPGKPGNEWLEKCDMDYRVIHPSNGEDFRQINGVLSSTQAEYLLFIDARKGPVLLKKAGLQTFAIAAMRKPDAAFFYSDYELAFGNEKKEVKLLFHHIGRVRDNQDYGSVFFVKKTSFEKMGYFDESVRFNHWYDARLKLSETGELVRIGNKYNGSLYSRLSQATTSNVFDYLMSGRDVQLEAEKILTQHLKRINAYLRPGFFSPIPDTEERQADLAASIIIPVGNRPEFIATAIDSIQAQTVQNIEAIIIVNGGEDDPTAEVVRHYLPGGLKYDLNKPEIRLMVIDINNIGLCLNIGVQNARGNYYVQLDSDDRLKPNAVEKILAVFQADPGIGMVIGSYEVWEKKEDGTLNRMSEIPVVTHDEWTPENGRNNLLRINGAGAPRSIPIHVIKKMGYFSINDDAFARNYGEDYEMVNKIAEHLVIGRVYDPIYEVVRHAGGTDHAISQDLIDRNDEAKDDMRKAAIERRIALNEGSK